MNVEIDSRLRADAERNRGRITDAARHLFATQGLDVSMASVARAAGVGKATLARRFATQGDLIAAVFEDRMRAYVRATELALAESDPWLGFVHYIEGVCSMQAADRGFADVLTTSFNGADLLEELRVQAYKGFLEVIERARSTGHLRADFVSEDLFVILLANAAVVAATADVTDAAWRRLVGHMLRAFATPDAPLPPLPPAPSSADLEKAMSRIGVSKA
ncbi:TetR/AcrR family transcriptional regulator [Rathayibacter caricis DSM 15933]|uniref:TetR/AcrR family transcriptional regulator n=1 Tax=Rathayibacter caricis DSM 15933 TaxID=1328867 RepID=A0A2T4UQU8_9MICO|nr:TetR/AcrR family transcriptional regulator [Rathayibacter caricis]PTL71908.1 TetR/AcrR family transcriptional regulator [Rathayibacter caricis DSM 15933]